MLKFSKNADWIIFFKNFNIPPQDSQLVYISQIFFSVARFLHFFHVTMDTESMMDFNFLLYIVNTRRYCDPEKKTDLETLTELHILNLLNKKNLCFLMLFVCLYTWICAWPAPEQFGGFYSYWVLKSLCIIGWSLANVNILAPKICTLQRSSHPRGGEKQKTKLSISWRALMIWIKFQ